MSDSINQNDDRWLDALAGNSGVDEEDPPLVEALAVRKALQARAQRLDALVPPADDALLEQLQFHLRRERLIGTRTVFRSPLAWALAATVVLGVGLALTVLVMEDQSGPSMVDLPGVPSTPTEPEAMASQALSFATLIAAADPEAKAEELIRGMPMDLLGPRAGAVVGITPGWRDRLSWNDAKRSYQALSGLSREQVQSGVPVVIELGQDQIMVVVQATDAMVEYLRSKNIEPTVTDGEIVLLIHVEDSGPLLNPSPDASL